MKEGFAMMSENQKRAFDAATSIITAAAKNIDGIGSKEVAEDLGDSFEALYKKLLGIIGEK